MPISEKNTDPCPPQCPAPNYYIPPQYQPQYQQQVPYFPQSIPHYPPAFVERPNAIVMNGANPIRGMYTSMQNDVCSAYGSSNVPITGYDMYGGSRWCQVGVVVNEHTFHPNHIMALEAQFRGQQWTFRIKDPISGLSLMIDQVGKGPYSSFRSNDLISIPGKDGLWRIQIQTQDYVLYMPV